MAVCREGSVILILILILMTLPSVDSPRTTSFLALVQSSGRAATSGQKALRRRAPLGSGVLRVGRGGSGAENPPLAARPGKSESKISL